MSIDNRSQSTYSAHALRWHGIENPFGDTQTVLDGVVIKNSAVYNEVYATDDPLFYNDYSKMRVVGIEIKEQSYIKEWNLGNTAEIIPRLNGGSRTQYKCAWHQIYGSNVGLHILFVCGDALLGSLGYFNTYFNINALQQNFGYRSSCIIK